MLREKKANIGAVGINYAENLEAGSPLVMLHGLPGRWQEFMPIMSTLTLRWHVFALDFRGQGKSDRTPGQYQAKYYVGDVVQFLRQQLEEPAILFGLSAGGLVALSVAAQNPELVSAIIIGDSPVDIKVLVEWMTSGVFQDHFSALQKIAGLEDISVQEIGRRISDIVVHVPGQEAGSRFGDSSFVGRQFAG